MQIGTISGEVSGRPKAEISIAIGWVLLTAALSQTLPSTDFSVTLFGLVIAEISGSLLVMGLTNWQNAKSLPQPWEDAIGHLMLRWVIFVIIVIALMQMHEIAIFEHHDYATICVLGLSLVLALIKLVCAYQTSNSRLRFLLARLRYVSLSVGILGFSNIAPLNSDIVLSITIGFLLIILLSISFGVNFSKAIEQTSSVEIHSQRTPFAVSSYIFRHIDVILIATVLSPREVLIYLIARGVSGMVPLSLNLLGDRIFDTLIIAFQNRNLQQFVSLAARTNLGFMLIGGSAALIALSTGSYVSIFFNLDPEVFKRILFWLLVAEATPVIFGATGILLNISGYQREVMLLSLAGVLAVWIVSNVMGISDPTQLAKLFACIQILIAGVSAVLLGARFGIWPGLTALLFRQIKLL